MQTLPTRKFEIYDEVRIYRTQVKRKFYGDYERTTPTGERGTIIGYAITDDGWEYFVKVDGTHMYHQWVREIGLERVQS